MKTLPPPPRPEVNINFYVVCVQGGAPYTLVSELTLDGRVIRRHASPPMDSIAVPHCFQNDITAVIASGIVGTVEKHLDPKIN